MSFPTGSRLRPLSVLATILIVGSPVGCVGSEPGSEGTDRARALGDTNNTPVTSFGRDTATALAYQPVKVEVESEQPRKVRLHLIVFQQPTRDQTRATMRAALDSLGGADSTLAAARAILYTGRPGRGGMDFVPAAWAEWVPPEGFDSARVRSADRIYRVYVFHTNPGWDAPDGSADQEG